MLKRVAQRLVQPATWLPQQVACMPWEDHLLMAADQQQHDSHRIIHEQEGNSNQGHISQPMSVHGCAQTEESSQATQQVHGVPYHASNRVQLEWQCHTDISSMHHCHQSLGRRAASTLTKAGIPKPRPGVEAELSTYKGGHLVRMIRHTQSLRELDMLLGKHAETLSSVHLAAAAKKLEKLFRSTGASPHELRVKSVATRIEKSAVDTAAQLPVLNLASILYGLTGSSHALSSASLTALAAVPLASGCRQMQLAGDTQWRHIVWGFAMQGYDNPVFWQQLCSTAVPLIPHWSPNCAASVLKNMIMAGVRSDALLLACIQNMTQQVHFLQPASIADGTYGVAAVAAGILKSRPQQALSGQAVQADEEAEQADSTVSQHKEAVQQFVSAIVAHAMSPEVLKQFTAKQLALFLHSLARLGWSSQEVAAKAGAAVVQGLPNSQQLHPLYAHKLLSACKDMGHEDVKLASKLAELCTPLLHLSDSHVRQQLHAVVQSSLGKCDTQPHALVAFLRAISKFDGQTDS